MDITLFQIVVIVVLLAIPAAVAASGWKRGDQILNAWSGGEGVPATGRLAGLAFVIAAPPLLLLESNLTTLLGVVAIAVGVLFPLWQSSDD